MFKYHEVVSGRQFGPQTPIIFRGKFCHCGVASKTRRELIFGQVASVLLGSGQWQRPVVSGGRKLNFDPFDPFDCFTGSAFGPYGLLPGQAKCQMSSLCCNENCPSTPEPRMYIRNPGSQEMEFHTRVHGHPRHLAYQVKKVPITNFGHQKESWPDIIYVFLYTDFLDSHRHPSKFSLYSMTSSRHSVQSTWEVVVQIKFLSGSICAKSSENVRYVFLLLPLMLRYNPTITSPEGCSVPALQERCSATFTVAPESKEPSLKNDTQCHR